MVYLKPLDLVSSKPLDYPARILTVSSNLIVHCGARRLSWEELKALPDPLPRGPKHMPLPHHEFISTLKGVLGVRDFVVTQEEFAVYGEEGERLFGLLDVLAQGSNPLTDLQRAGASFSLGTRGGNDFSMSRQLIAGEHLGVCDNMLFSGEFIALQRKQTTGMQLEAELEGAIDRFLEFSADLARKGERAREMELATDQAKAIMFDQFANRVLPARKLPAVAAWYFDPPEGATDLLEFPRTLWALVQAFTRECRDLKPAPKFRATAALGKLLDLRRIP